MLHQGSGRWTGLERTYIGKGNNPVSRTCRGEKGRRVKEKEMGIERGENARIEPE